MIRKAVSAALFIWLSWASASWAQIEETDLPSLEPLFRETSQVLGVPLDWTMAIAEVESGFSPWALNIEGRSYQFDSKEKALEKAREAWNEGRSFDSGLMQVNSWWLKKYGLPLEAALDPEANVYLGAWILGREIARHGGLRAAVGAYHSPVPARANAYAETVRAALERGPLQTPKRAGNKPAAPAPQAARKKTAVTPQGPAASPLLIASRDKAVAKPETFKMIVSRDDELQRPAGGGLLVKRCRKTE